MKNLSPIVIFVCMATMSSQATDLHVLVTGRFGHAVEGCNVTLFRSQQDGVDYASTFTNLVSSVVPVGLYEVRVNCGEREGFRKIAILPGSRLQIVALRERFMLGDAPARPVVVRTQPKERGGEASWIKLVGLYNDEVYSQMFDMNGIAKIDNLESGSYIVMVHRRGSTPCTAEIDTEEWTERWALDVETCTINVDEYAHVVTPEDKSGGKQGGWYDEMDRRRDRVRSEIRRIIRSK